MFQRRVKRMLAEADALSGSVYPLLDTRRDD
jgi:hypothetical protein